MLSLIPILILASLATLLSSCSPRPPSTASHSIVFALKPDKDPEKMLEERQRLANFLEAHLDTPAEVIVPLSSAVIFEGLSNGTLDLAYLSATDMAPAHSRQVASILLAGEIDGQPSYKSYWLALKDKPYQSVADLRNKPVAFASRTSTSGYLIPHWDLIKQGLLPEKAPPEEFFGPGNVWYGSGYVSAVERVLDGTAEAAAVSYYVLDKDKHLTEEQRARLKVVDVQGPVPTHVIAVRSSIPAGRQEEIKEALLALNEPENQELRDNLFTSKLIPVDPQEHISTLDEAFRLTGKLD